MGAGLRGRARREISFALGCFVDSGVRLLFHRSVHFSFGWRRRRFFVGLDSCPDDLAVHELVAVDMGPEAVVVRPTGRERCRRDNLGRGALLLRRGMFFGRLGLQRGCRERAQKRNR